MIKGDLIKRLRIEREMTQRALAAKANITEVTLSSIENGHIKRPKMETISRIAKALGVKGRTLMEEDW